MKRLFTTLSLALPLATMAASPAQNLIEKIAQNQAEIVKSFQGPGNLEGFIIKAKNGPGRETVVYADKQGQYMVAGALIGPNGENFTQQDYKQYVTDAMAPKVIQAANQTAWFDQGNPKAPHQAYVLVEPNCIACHMLYKEMRPLIQSGQLYVKWIMVSFLKPDSNGKAAAILTAKDPAKAFNMDEANFDMKKEEGSITPASNISADAKAKLKQNMSFMEKFNFMATPVIIYKDKQGKAQIVNGFPPGDALKKMVSSMASLN